MIHFIDMFLENQVSVYFFMVILAAIYLSLIFYFLSHEKKTGGRKDVQ